MNDWVRDPRLLDVIVKLRGMKPGDWVEETWVGEPTRSTRAVLIPSHFMRDPYDIHDRILANQSWKLTGWRRPTKEKP